MKFSFAYVKKNPVMFGLIILVFGVVFLLLLNKGADKEQQITQSGPSDAQLALQAQLASKQLEIAGQVQIGGLQLQGLAQQGANDFALAQIAANVQLAGIAANAHAQELGIVSSLQALNAQLAANVQMNNDNNQFQVDYATIAADNSLAIIEANAALQTTLSQNQLQAFTVGTLAQQIGTVKKGSRDNAFMALLGAVSNQSIGYYPGAGNAVVIGAQPAGALNVNNAGSSSNGGFFSSLVNGGLGAVSLLT